MANNFTDQVYDKVRGVITGQKFEGDWQSFMKDKVRASSLIAADGPSTSDAEGLDKLRSKLTDTVKESSKDGGSATTVAKTIMAAAKPGNPDAKWKERAATIKMLKHLYRYSKRGAQDVWVYSPPKAYSKWIFDEIEGTEAAIASKLDKEDEIYTDADKKVMCDALKIALSCSQKTEKLLSEGADTTVAVVKRWFAQSSTTADQTKEDIKTLLAGFKKITNLCNSNKLIFPDDPNDRKSSSKYKKLYGSVWPGGEGSFPVIYLAGAFTKAGNSGKLWLCAETIVHEASHLEVRTKDHRYDSAGLKPGAAFPRTEAIENADSWGYFCIDLCGYLSKADRDTVLV